jgi:phenylpyruvate tautomerase PptA (4-oxalocrotonate tautomerase family)
VGSGVAECARSHEDAEQGDEADEAFGGMVARLDMPPHARAGRVGRGHRLAAYPRCSTDVVGAWPGRHGEECMPSVKIEMRRWMSAQTKQAVLDAVHASLVSAFKIPDHDRNQRVVEYEPEDFESSAGKGERFTIVTTDAFSGRSIDAKRALYGELCSRLSSLGIPPNDLLVIIHDVPLESWGTRGGKAACDIDLGFEVKV